MCTIMSKIGPSSLSIAQQNEHRLTSFGVSVLDINGAYIGLFGCIPGWLYNTTTNNA